MNEKYGRLKVLKVQKNNKVKYICDCGNVAEVRMSQLKNGKTKSCGCLRKEAITKHGMWKHPLYNTWKAMKNRCLNTNDKDYSHYGGRGIKIDPSWLDVKKYIKDIEEHLGERPSGMTIDRIDNNKGYYIDNLRYANASEQSVNQRHKPNKLGQSYKNIYERKIGRCISYEIRMKRNKVERIASTNSLEIATKIRDYWLSEYEEDKMIWVERTKTKEYREDVNIWKKTKY